MPDYSQFHLDKGEFIPTYAGSPLDIVADTNKALQERHYKNIADMSAMELALKQMQANALPGARDYIAQQVGNVHDQLKQMAESGAENSTAKVQALRNTFLGDEGLIHAGQRAKEYQEKLDLASKIASETGKPAVYNKKAFEALQNAPVYTQDEKGNQILNPLYSQQFSPHVSRYLDPTVDYKKITDEIKPDSWISQGLAPEKVVTFNNAKYKFENGEIDIPKFLSEAKAAGITPEKIKGLKNLMFNAYKKTSSYEQQKDYFDKDDETQKEDLMKYGLLGTYHQIDKHYHQISGGGDGSGKGGVQIPFGGGLLDRAVKQEAIQPVMPWSASVKLNAVGDPEEARGKALANLLSGEKGELPAKTSEREKVANKNFVNLVRVANEAANGEMTNATSDEEIEKYIKEHKEEAQQMVKTFLNDFYKDKLSNAYATPIVDPKALAMVDNLVKRNPSSFSYYDEDGKKVDYGTDEWVKLTGGNAQAFNYGNTLDAYNSRAGIIKEDDAASGLHTITVDGGKDNPTKTFYIADPSNQRGPVKNLNIIYNKTIAHPGMFTDVGNGIQARFLVGKQKEAAWFRHKNELIKAAAAQGVPPEQREGWAQTQFMQNYQTLIEYKDGDKVVLGTPASLGAISGELSYKK